MRKLKLPARPLRYASRGGLKLEGALEDFGVTPRDQICLDVGSSTGGFTDCLLQNGARKVYAVDVTIDQLDWKLRHRRARDNRGTNARYLRPEDIGEPSDFVTMDVSFISVSKILPAIVPVAVARRRFPDSDQAAIRAGEARSAKAGSFATPRCTRRRSSA